MHPSELWWLIEAKAVAPGSKAGAKRELEELWEDMKHMEGFPYGGS